MKRLLITEEEKNSIKKLYHITEIDAQKALQSLASFVGQSSNTQQTNIPDSSDSDSVNVEAGEYFTHPNADSITLKYRPSAIKLNPHAELLLKSIFAEAGTPNLEITSTLRTYEDQARANSQNRRQDIVNWYGADVAKVWDNLKSGQMTQQEFANYLKDRDSKRGKLMSNHLSGVAIDIAPYSDKFVSTAERLKKQGNSGIRKIFREKENQAVHIEFNFPVTDKGGLGTMPSGSPTKRSEKKSDKAIFKSGIIIDTFDPNSNRYALIYGGSPSSKYGAQFMYNQGSSILNKNVVYANHEVPISTIEQELKTINPNAVIKSVSGFSGGGTKTIQAMDSGKYDFIGLIDPFISQQRQNLPSNVKMISRAANWSSTKYPKTKNILQNMENSGISELISSTTYNHDDMPKIFFQKYGNLV